MMLLLVPVAFGLGAFAWTFAEYTLHRFAFHDRGGSWYGSKEHLLHHAERNLAAIGFVTKPGVISWAGIVATAVAIFLPIGSLAGGPPVGAALAAGWVAGYFTYEWLHYSSHHRAPRNPYEAWLRRHHLFHHFGHPQRNHGVTSPLWDHVFGTYSDSSTVRVPRRMAPVWLLDAAGNVAAPFGDQYFVVGGQDSSGSLLRDDRHRAFANVAPAD